MTYAMGVDLGTTYSAAAVSHGGATQVVALGHRVTVVPSAVFVTTDGDVLVGAAAVRRGAAQPDRLAREFKRRMGDSVPLIVGGAPWSAEALTARLLLWVVRQVEEQQGGPPEQLTVTYPANWGAFKQDRLTQALRMAELDHVTTLTEPEAAAQWYAAAERVPPGEVVAVYDLGGGTFDAAILRKTETGFDVLGSPEGIERLGGIDIDEAVFAHVLASLGERFHADDLDDPGTAMVVARLRADCVDAKEALSSDTHVSVPVVLHGGHTEVRLTRTELEAMVSPLLEDSTAALRRAIHSAGLAPDDVDRVLLVGGASRMPLVGRMVSEAFGRPYFVDAHPKHTVCLGAALEVAGQPGPLERAAPRPVAVGAPEPPAVPTAAVAPPVAVGTPPGGGSAYPQSPGRSTRAHVATGLVAVVAAMAVVLVTAMVLRPDGTTATGASSTSGPSTSENAEGTNPTAPSEPTLEMTRSTSLEGATSLAVLEDGVWVTAQSAGTLARFDAELAESPEMFALDPGALAADVLAVDGAIWVAVSYPVEGDVFLSDLELIRLDPATGETIGTIPVDRNNGEAHLTAGAGSIWLVTSRWNDATGLFDHVLLRVDPETAQVVADIELATGGSVTAQDVVAGDDRVWVAVTDIADTTNTSGRIIAIDPARNEVVDEDEIELGEGAVGDLALAASGLWVIHWGGGPGGEDVIVRLDPASGDTIEDLAVDANRIAAAGDWIWVMNSTDGLEETDDSVALIDPDSNTVVDELDLPGDLTAVPYLAAADDTAWFTHGSEVHRVDVSR